MKLAVATIWRTLRTELADIKNMSEVAAGMEQEDGSDVAGPVAGRLDLRFIPV